MKLLSAAWPRAGPGLAAGARRGTAADRLSGQGANFGPDAPRLEVRRLRLRPRALPRCSADYDSRAAALPALRAARLRRGARLAAGRLHLAGRRPARLAALAEDVREIGRPLLCPLRGRQQLPRRPAHPHRPRHARRRAPPLQDRPGPDLSDRPFRRRPHGLHHRLRPARVLRRRRPHLRHQSAAPPRCPAPPRPRSALGGLRHRRERLQPQRKRGVTWPRCSADLGIRSKLWVVPKMGHAMPPSTTCWARCMPGWRARPEAPPRGRQGPPRPGPGGRRGARRRRRWRRGRWRRPRPT